MQVRQGFSQVPDRNFVENLVALGRRNLPGSGSSPLGTRNFGTREVQTSCSSAALPVGGWLGVVGPRRVKLNQIGEGAEHGNAS